MQIVVNNENRFSFGQPIGSKTDHVSSLLLILPSQDSVYFGNNSERKTRRQRQRQLLSFATTPTWSERTAKNVTGVVKKLNLNNCAEAIELALDKNNWDFVKLVLANVKNGKDPDQRLNGQFAQEALAQAIKEGNEDRI